MVAQVIQAGHSVLTHSRIHIIGIALLRVFRGPNAARFKARLKRRVLHRTVPRGSRANRVAVSPF